MNINNNIDLQIDDFCVFFKKLSTSEKTHEMAERIKNFFAAVESDKRAFNRSSKIELNLLKDESKVLLKSEEIFNSIVFRRDSTEDDVKLAKFLLLFFPYYDFHKERIMQKIKTMESLLKGSLEERDEVENLALPKFPPLNRQLFTDDMSLESEESLNNLIIFKR